MGAAGKTARHIIDGGAFQGDITARYLEHFPEAHVWAFEPTPAMVEVLRERFRSESRVTVVAAALGQSEGRMRLTVNDAPPTNSLLPLDDAMGSYLDYPVATLGQVEVETVTLDAFCAANGLESLVVKLDVQGAEHGVIAGAHARLRLGTIDLFFTEVNFVHVYQDQTPIWSLIEELHGFDYRLYDFYGGQRSPQGQLKWCDALFTSAELRRLAGI